MYKGMVFCYRTRDFDRSLTFTFFLSYFHKIPEEAPELELKATHGLASPQEFTLPAPHAMWGGDTYAGFDVSKAHPPQPVGLLSRGDGGGGNSL